MKGKIITLATLAILSGCTNYYAVHDDGTGATYYTRHVTEYGDGSVGFVDSSSAGDVVVTNATVTQISEQDYNDNWRTRPLTGLGTRDYDATPAAAHMAPEGQPYSTATTQPSESQYRTNGMPTSKAEYDQTYRKSTRQTPNSSLISPSGESPETP